MKCKTNLSSKAIFYKEIKNIKQTLINNGFPNNIVDEQIKRMIKNVIQQNKHSDTPANKQAFIKLFLHNNGKSDEHILKTLIQKNIITTDPQKIKLLIYYNKFKTPNLVIDNNSSPSTGVLQKTNVLYQFKCPLGDCIPENNNIYVNYSIKKIRTHFSDTSFILQHLKTLRLTTEFRKILTENTIWEQ